MRDMWRPAFMPARISAGLAVRFALRRLCSLHGRRRWCRRSSNRCGTIGLQFALIHDDGQPRAFVGIVFQERCVSAARPVRRRIDFPDTNEIAARAALGASNGGSFQRADKLGIARDGGNGGRDRRVGRRRWRRIRHFDRTRRASACAQQQKQQDRGAMGLHAIGFSVKPRLFCGRAATALRKRGRPCFASFTLIGAAPASFLVGGNGKRPIRTTILLDLCERAPPRHLKRCLGSRRLCWREL